MVPGMTIKIRGPKGQMRYTPNMAREIGMLAAGTGITPMLPILRAILPNPADLTRVSLLYANVSVEDILLREDLEDLARRYPEKFTVYFVVERDPDGVEPRPLERWVGGVGYITEDMVRKRCPSPDKDVKILVCGPPGMVSAMRKHVEVRLPQISLM
jgi:cytochrome-b5 reductase